jgi:hypothetical protein
MPLVAEEAHSPRHLLGYYMSANLVTVIPPKSQSFTTMCHNDSMPSSGPQFGG